jgi:hypothetical protein
MTLPLKLTIPNRIAFNISLISGMFILSTGGPLNLMKPIMLNEYNHAELTIDKGKNYY